MQKLSFGIITQIQLASQSHQTGLGKRLGSPDRILRVVNFWTKRKQTFIYLLSNHSVVGTAGEAFGRSWYTAAFENSLRNHFVFPVVTVNEIYSPEMKFQWTREHQWVSQEALWGLVYNAAGGGSFLCTHRTPREPGRTLALDGMLTSERQVQDLGREESWDTQRRGLIQPIPGLVPID